jgi:integrase/recombinase XerD
MRVMTDLANDVTDNRYRQLTDVVADSVIAQESRRAYRKGVEDFLSWLPPRVFDRHSVQEYCGHLLAKGYAHATVNLRLCAVRRLAVEAADCGFIDQGRVAGIGRVKGPKHQGLRLGRWATADETTRLLAAPTRTLRGLRDRAILSVLVGCGLRRGELVTLRVVHVQQREGRAVLADLVGKGGRIRTVALPAWVHCALEDWLRAASISTGRIFRAITKAGRVSESLSTAAVRSIVAAHARTIGLALAPHDLRRTCAKLCRNQGGEIEQIRFLLGHASVQTTERYLGIRQELRVAVNDRLGFVVTIPHRGVDPVTHERWSSSQPGNP